MTRFFLQEIKIKNRVINNRIAFRNVIQVDKKYSSALGFSPVWFVHLQVE
jgi:hypothetical protein